MPDRFHYTCYGLTIQSQLPLPELLHAVSSVPEIAPAEVDIRIGPVAPEGLPGGTRLGPFLWVTVSSLWLQVPKVARFLVSEGREIVIDPEPGIDADSLRVFLLGSALGALLFQRGLLVLHGNAIRIGEQCMVCVGHSGAGKSTLAAGFLRRGHEILADDVVPVATDCRALPGFPRFSIPAPVDLVLHSATHLFHEGEWQHGLRDLVDLDALLRAYGGEPAFWGRLLERARTLNLGRPLYYALRYARRLLHTPVPEEAIANCPERPSSLSAAVMDVLFLPAFACAHAECRGLLTRPAAFVLYVRSHWLRMPLHLLLPHLLRKAWKPEGK